MKECFFSRVPQAPSVSVHVNCDPSWHYFYPIWQKVCDYATFQRKFVKMEMVLDVSAILNFSAPERPWGGPGDDFVPFCSHPALPSILDGPLWLTQKVITSRPSQNSSVCDWFITRQIFNLVFFLCVHCLSETRFPSFDPGINITFSLTQ